MTEKFNPLDYWGKIAIERTKEVYKLKEMILNWIIMLSSPDFKDTDAELVREEMIKSLVEELSK